MENNAKTIIIEHKSNRTSASPDKLGLVEFLSVCRRNWRWFILSLVLCIGTAVAYVYTTTPKFTRTAAVHIKEDRQGRSSGAVSDELVAMGLASINGSVNNELAAFNSPTLARQVVEQLHLEVTYKHFERFRDKVLYGKSLPIQVEFLDLDEREKVTLHVFVLPNGKLYLASIEQKHAYTEPGITVEFDKKVKTVVGNLLFTKTDYYRTFDENYEIEIERTSIAHATEHLSKTAKIVQDDAKNSIIDITYTDENTQRADDIINTIISEYNKNWIRDKKMVGDLTSKFIDDRIKIIQEELGNVDSDISEYKSANLITDPQQAAAMYMNQANQSNQERMAINNQISMCNYLYKYIANEENRYKLIPANTGIQSTTIASTIAGYNQKLLSRNTMVNNSSTNNPVVQNLDAELESQRSIILQIIQNEKVSLESTLSASNASIAQSTSKLASNPTQQKNLLSMDRQQKIKESLYLFMLQKREENEISQAFDAYNTRIIATPSGSELPSSPVKSRVLLVAIICGLFIPLLVLYLHELLYTKVRDRKDLEKMSVPVVGEIPQQQPARWKVWQRRKGRMSLLVEKDNCNMINEAFRMARSNLSFMLNAKDGEERKVILVTSANPNSGKTFTTLNMAEAFALQGNRVMVVDLDIRKATFSRFVGKQKLGVTDYLGGYADNWQDLVVKRHFDTLPVGHIPPNPAELLQSKRLEQLLGQLKQCYDIIFLDMPPADAVADVTIVKHLADMTLFIVRAGIMDRSLLPLIERNYTEGRFHNMTLLLNGTLPRHNRYGYNYGYGYGYGSR